jgi:hypothetical protein
LQLANAQIWFFGVRRREWPRFDASFERGHQTRLARASDFRRPVCDDEEPACAAVKLDFLSLGMLDGSSYPQVAGRAF